MKIPILSRWMERRSTLAQPQQWFLDALGGSKSNAGVRVNEDTALRSTAVFACVKILAETVASLPLPVYRRLEGGGKERATRHYLYRLLHDLPNPELTSFEMREVLQGHLGLRGNAYCQIVRDRLDRPAELWPLPPQRMSVKRVNRELQYRLQLDDGMSRVFTSRDIWHIKAFSRDGVTGLAPIGQAREAIGLALATEEFGSRFFGSGTNIGGIAKHPGKLTEQGSKNLRESINETYGGLGKSHRVMLLEEGMEFEKVGIPPEDAQFLETRKFQLNEIARIYRIPPHMIGDLDRATFSNIEQQSIDFVVNTIRPWLVRWEQSITKALIPEEEQGVYFAEFLVDGLLRGDIKSRYEAYAVGRQNGWLSADDIRELENMNPLPDGQGKVYLVPLNMVPAQQVIDGTVDDGPAEEPPDTRATREARSVRSATARRRIGNSYRRVFADAAARVVRRERSDVMRAAEKFLGRRDAGQFTAWLEDFYRDHGPFIEQHMLPTFLAYAEAIQAEAADEIGLPAGMTPELEEFVRAYLAVYITRHIGSSLGQLREVVREAIEAGEDPIPALEKRFQEWEERRPNKIALRETVQAGNAIAKATYTQGGVTKIRWRNYSDTCPYCKSLDGRTISISGNFATKDDELKPEGVDKPLTFSSNIGHPPAHGGCDCHIVAAS